MEDRFSGLMQRLGLEESCVKTAFPVLVEHYSRADRHYHNLGHVSDCLWQLDEVRHFLDDPDAAELALWFHDAVYDPDASDNELRSALLFDRELGVRLPTGRADSVHAMIMATVHPSDAESNDSQFVADIDLAGFAMPRPEFLRTTELLRREFHHLTDTQFQLGTVSFFEKILSRRSIYLTEHFRARCEAQARRNISGFLEGSTG